MHFSLLRCAPCCTHMKMLSICLEGRFIFRDGGLRSLTKSHKNHCSTECRKRIAGMRLTCATQGNLNLLPNSCCTTTTIKRKREERKKANILPGCGHEPKNRSLKTKIEMQPFATFEETVTVFTRAVSNEWDCGHQVTGNSTVKKKKVLKQVRRCAASHVVEKRPRKTWR